MKRKEKKEWSFPLMVQSTQKNWMCRWKLKAALHSCKPRLSCSPGTQVHISTGEGSRTGEKRKNKLTWNGTEIENNRTWVKKKEKKRHLGFNQLLLCIFNMSISRDPVVSHKCWRAWNVLVMSFSNQCHNIPLGKTAVNLPGQVRGRLQADQEGIILRL